MAVLYPTDPVALAAFASRFWSKVQKSDEPDTCWLWTGYILPPPQRYGMHSFGKRSIHEYAHRVAYHLIYGPIPKGLFVCHRCDVRHCCRPDHFFLGTHQDNMADMFQKDRQSKHQRPTGEDHTSAKLTWPIVREIRKRYISGGRHHGNSLALSKEFNICQRNIWAIGNRRIWKHDPAEIAEEPIPQPLIENHQLLLGL